jgi:hypothetical protein
MKLTWPLFPEQHLAVITTYVYLIATSLENIEEGIKRIKNAISKLVS